MAAAVITWGEPPPTAGGDFEREVIRTLRDKLPEQLTLVTNPALATRTGYLYEFDIVLCAPGLCDVLECKCIKPKVHVLEDCLRGHGGFSVDRAFSLLDSKGRVLASRLGEAPFVLRTIPRVFGRIVLPSQSEIEFLHRDHEAGARVLTLAGALNWYKTWVRGHLNECGKRALQELRDSWAKYRERSSPGLRTQHTLGRFMLRRVLSEQDGIREYLATDEPPCKVDVHLKETPYDPVLREEELAEYLSSIAWEMQTRRLIRHPGVQCVIGHFQTGTSFVEVSDWFEGKALEEEWGTVETLSLSQKVGLLIKIAEALAFCHQRGVFHRNLHAGNVLVNSDCNDLRVRGFDLARNLQLSRTVSQTALNARDQRIIPPEALKDRSVPCNARLADVYQVGVLWFRIIEDGAWPFVGGIDRAAGQEEIRPMVHHADEDGIEPLRRLIRSMLDIDPLRRPDPMNKVEGMLYQVVGGK